MPKLLHPEADFRHKHAGIAELSIIHKSYFKGEERDGKTSSEGERALQRQESGFDEDQCFASSSIAILRARRNF